MVIRIQSAKRIPVIHHRRGELISKRHKQELKRNVIRRTPYARDTIHRYIYRLTWNGNKQNASHTSMKQFRMSCCASSTSRAHTSHTTNFGYVAFTMQCCIWCISTWLCHSIWTVRAWNIFSLLFMVHLCVCVCVSLVRKIIWFQLVDLVAHVMRACPLFLRMAFSLYQCTRADVRWCSVSLL